MTHVRPKTTAPATVSLLNGKQGDLAVASNRIDSRIDDAAMRPISRTLAMRYGVSQRRPVSAWLIGVGAVLTGAVSVVGGAGVLGIFGALLWGAILALADRRAHRPAVLLAWSSLAMLAVFILPVAPQFGDLLADPQWIPVLLIGVAYSCGGIVPLVVTPIIVYLWFARTGQMR